MKSCNGTIVVTKKMSADTGCVLQSTICLMMNVSSSAFVEGTNDPAHLFRSHKFHSWLQGQSVGLSIEDDLDL